VTKGDQGPARHERPVIDEAALAAARGADRLLEAAHMGGATTWEEYLSPVPGQLRDAGVGELRKVALRARAAYGPRASIRDALPAQLTEPFLADLDRLLKALARDLMER